LDRQTLAGHQVAWQTRGGHAGAVGDRLAEHPYHALIKDYKLTRDALNDPVADARIAGRLLLDARLKLREVAAAQPTFARVVHSLALAGWAR